MSTRQEYLDGLVSHEQYYEQFVDQGLRRDTQTYVLFFSPERAGEAEQLYNLLQTKRAFDPMTPVDRWDDHLCEIASTRVADAYILVHNALRAGILVGYEVY